jgi:predicted chitinase
MVIRAINNEMIYIKDHMEDETVPKAEEDEDEEETAEALYKTSDLNAALERGDDKDYGDIYDYLMEIKQEGGKTEAQARSSVKSSITYYWRKRYLEAWEANDTGEIKRIQAILTGTKLYGSRNEVAKMGEGWVKAYAESLIKK